MDWKKFFAHYLRTVILWMLIAAAGLGLLGFVLAGVEGMKNGAVWGLVLGLFGGLMSGSVMIYAFFWGDVAGKGGAAWLKDETTGSDSFHKK